MTNETDSTSNPEPQRPETPPAQGASSYDPKVVGIVAYITLIGWVVALIMNNPKSAFGSFHIRQSLGIMLLFFLSAFVMIIPILGWIIGILGYLFAFVLWIIGLVGAVQDKTSPVPVIGDKAQEWFKSL